MVGRRTLCLKNIEIDGSDSQIIISGRMTAAEATAHVAAERAAIKSSDVRPANEMILRLRSQLTGLVLLRCIASITRELGSRPEIDSLEYGEAVASKLVLIGYNIKFSINELHEKMCKFEEFTQSVDITANLPVLDGCD
jgi:hypothetical protein